MSVSISKHTNSEILQSLSSLRAKISNKMEKIEETVMESFDSIPSSGQLKFYETAVKQTENNRNQILKTVIGTLENAKREKGKSKTGDSTTRNS